MQHVLRRAFGLGLRSLAFNVPAAHLIRSQKFASHLAIATESSHQTLSYGIAQAEVDFYRVKVITGRRRGSSTTDTVNIQLMFSGGESGIIPLVADGGFDRGSTREFTVPAPKDLGALRRLFIEKEAPEAFERKGGWYLCQVEVESPTGENMLFPCNSWIGDSDCGMIKASCARNLLPAANEMQPAYHEPVHVLASGMAIPHPDKVKDGHGKGVNQRGFGYGGEDAYFYAQGRNNVFGMGVADGVYSWRNVGIDSGHLAQALMRTSMHMAQAGVEDVFKVFQTSARYVQSEGLQGSCTTCLLTVNQANGQLHAANLGDAGFMVFGRPRALLSFQAADLDLIIKYKSGQLEHEFGRPYQLGHHANSSRVEDADLMSFYVSPGDVIVMGSDGLLDNLNEKEVCAALQQLIAAEASPGTMVQTLVKMAFEASLDKDRQTPYSQGASDAFDMVYNGGKKDDITVLVAQCK